MYLHTHQEVEKPSAKVRLLGSGAILLEVITAAEQLSRVWNIDCEVWSVTSFTELAREAREVERWNRLHPRETQRDSHIGLCLAGDAPVIAASDYVRAVPQLTAAYIAPQFTVLGTDGFGRSDTRSALRGFFEVDYRHIVLASLTALVRQGVLGAEHCAKAIAQYDIEPDVDASWEC